MVTVSFINRLSHAVDLLENRSQQGRPFKVVKGGGSPLPGYTSGYMAPIPDEYQALLGAEVVTGACCFPMISRTSYGPALLSLDPTTLEAGRTGSVRTFQLVSISQ